MSIPTSASISVRRALLCVDSADSIQELGGKVFGQPLLAHQIRHLQRLGIQEIGLAVAQIAPEYPALAETMRSETLNISLLRSGRDISEFAGNSADASILLLDAAIWIDPGLLVEIATSKTPAVAILPEGPAAQCFERIDLNRRWAGYALIEPQLLRACGEIPEDWSIASYLLRAAIQAGYADHRVPDEQIVSGLVHSELPGFYQVVELKIRPRDPGMGQLDALFYGLWDRALSRWSDQLWYHAVVRGLFPFCALGAVLTSYFQYITSSYAFLFVSLLGYLWSDHQRQIEYKADGNDPLTWASAGLLCLALVQNLRVQTGWIDAIFLVSVALGLLVLQKWHGRTFFSRQLSPLMLGILMLAGQVAGYGLAAFKLAILMMLAAVLIPPRLNPN